MARLITKGKFSEMCGVTRSSIAHHIQLGKRLFSAYDPMMSMIDIEHPDAIKFIEDYQAEKMAGISAQKIRGLDQGEISTKEFDNLTVKQICQMWGTTANCHEIFKIRKTLIDTEYKTKQLELFMGELVPKKEVADVCFSIIDQSFKQLLEMPAGVLPRVKALIESKPLDCDIQCTEIMSKQIGKIIKNTKLSVSKRITAEVENNEDK